MKKLFGKNLKKLRLEQGLSQARLAETINVSHATVYNWEAGRTDIDGRHLILLAKILNTSADEILGTASLPPLDEAIDETLLLINNLTAEEQKTCLLALKTFLACAKKNN